MSLKLLVNHAADRATSFAMISGSTASGTLYDLMSGPRSTLWRSAASSSAIQPGYSFASDVACTYLVAARADLMVTLAGAQVRAMQKSSGGAWSAISGTTIASLSASNLVGYKSQDLVMDLSSATNFRGVGLEFDSAGTEAMMMSKLYGCIGFDFGQPVDLGGISSSDIPDAGRWFTPQRSGLALETEQVFQLGIPALPRATLQAFKALPNLLSWPCFLYDTTGDIWDWKLEHVMIESWKESIFEADRHTLQITFRRLKHYV